MTSSSTPPPVADYRRHLDEWMATRRAESGDGVKEEQQQQKLSRWDQAPGAVRLATTL